MTDSTDAVDVEELQLALLDNEGKEISRTNINNEPSVALCCDLSMAIIANWVNSSLRIAGCPNCLGTHDVGRMIDSSMNNGKGTFALMLPSNFEFTIQ
ncbi:hypothetical protein HGB13_04560 [bacterium]|nr:hypothetical protein [bacterium]